MRRRDVLAGVGSLGVIGAAGVLATRGPSALDVDDQDTGGSDDESADPASADPLEIETIDAPGSEAGTMRVPGDGLMLIDFFATWCTICESQMPHLADARAEVDDDVAFLSVTNEPVGRSLSREDVADWWVEHDGNWPVGLDPTVELAERYDALQYPTTIIIDADGAVRWYNTGRKSVDDLLEAVETARAETGTEA